MGDLVLNHHWVSDSTCFFCRLFWLCPRTLWVQSIWSLPYRCWQWFRHQSDGKKRSGMEQESILLWSALLRSVFRFSQIQIQWTQNCTVRQQHNSSGAKNTMLRYSGLDEVDHGRKWSSYWAINPDRAPRLINERWINCIRLCSRSWWWWCDSLPSWTLRWLCSTPEGYILWNPSNFSCIASLYPSTKSTSINNKIT